MKILIIVALFASNAIACGTGCYEYHGSCACDQKPAVEQESYAKPSDEKPPKSGLPSWQDVSVKAATPSSLAAQDVLSEEAIKKADTEGKKAAGVPYTIPDSEVSQTN